MTNFAILDGNNKVINVVVADSIEDLSRYGTVIEDNRITPAGIDFTYDPINDIFINPVAVTDSVGE